MKHLAQIQTEFLKESSRFTRKSWDRQTLEEQRDYLKRHPKSKRRITAKPIKLKKELVDIPLKNKKDAIRVFDTSSLYVSDSEDINRKNIISVGKTRAKNDDQGKLEYYYTVIKTNKGKKYTLPEHLEDVKIDSKTDKRNIEN
jgi:hypothetical protein